MNVIRRAPRDQNKFADKRRTKIMADAEIEEEDLIQEENVAITLTHLGYIKTPTPIRHSAGGRAYRPHYQGQ